MLKVNAKVLTRNIIVLTQNTIVLIKNTIVLIQNTIVLTRNTIVFTNNTIVLMKTRRTPLLSFHYPSPTMRDALRVRLGSLLMVLLIAQSIGAGDRPEAVVKYRQSVMKAMAAHMTAISMVARQEIANDRQLAAHAEAIHGLSLGLGELFPAGTDAAKVKSAARLEIWRQPAEFKAAGAKLESESAKLLQLAQQRGAASNAAPNFHARLASQVDAVGAACKACHKTFRKSDTE